jgi:hypothetical protein
MTPDPVLTAPAASSTDRERAEPAATPVTGDVLPPEDKSAVSRPVLVAATAQDLVMADSVAALALAGDRLSLQDSRAIFVSAGGDASLDDSRTALAVAGGDIALTNGGGAAIVAGSDFSLTNGGGGFLIAGRDFQLTNGGGGFLIAGRDAHVTYAPTSNQAGVAVVAGGSARVERGAVGLLIARQASVDGATPVIVQVNLAPLLDGILNAGLKLADRLLGWLER